MPSVFAIASVFGDEFTTTPLTTKSILSVPTRTSRVSSSVGFLHVTIHCSRLLLMVLLVAGCSPSGLARIVPSFLRPGCHAKRL